MKGQTTSLSEALLKPYTMCLWTFFSGVVLSGSIVPRSVWYLTLLTIIFLFWLRTTQRQHNAEGSRATSEFLQGNYTYNFINHGVRLKKGNTVLVPVADTCVWHCDKCRLIVCIYHSYRVGSQRSKPIKDSSMHRNCPTWRQFSKRMTVTELCRLSV